MSEKKNLLNENTVRRFMKLAGQQAIASDFLEETYYQRDLAEAPEDEELGAEGELDVEAEAPLDELPPEPEGIEVEDPAEEEEPEAEGSVEAALRDILDAVQGVAKEHGVDMEVEELPEPDEIEVGEMEDVPEEDVPEMEAAPEEGDLGPEPEPEELAEISYIDEDALMETVYKRVAKRLANEKRADDAASVLAEKISKHLNKQ